MLTVKNLTFAYHKTTILKNLSFEVKAGENLAIIGESGSGKSTLLKLIYGTFDLNQGHIFWKEHQILGPKHNLIIGPDFMKYVSQEFDLMPMTSVSENIGSFLSNFYPEEKQLRIKELLDLVELGAYAKAKVKTLSGGQKQRVAIAKAIAKAPEVLLLDEPFSHIDNFKKQSLRRSLFQYLKNQNITCIMATHDKADVLSFSDRMMVLDHASIVANDTPKYIYKHPKHPLVASFFGEFNAINNQFVYANQLRVVNVSNFKVKVLKSYYQGAHYLIEAQSDSKSILFEHPCELKRNDLVCLEIID